MTLTGRDLAVIRGERLVFRGIDLDLGDGEALLLHGPNGAGKSSLLRVLAGLRRPDAGVLAWDGVPVDDDPVRHGRRVGFLGPLDAVKPGLSARENLRFAWRLGGRGPDAIDRALERVALLPLADLPARHLSTGQKRRLALARLALSGATLLLLDEPTTGLDDGSVALLGIMLAAHRGAGGAVIAATHGPIPLPGARVLALSPAPASFPPA